LRPRHHDRLLTHKPNTTVVVESDLLFACCLEMGLLNTDIVTFPTSLGLRV